MIIDKISGIGKLPISDEVATLVTEFIKNNDLNALPCGKYPLSGDHFVNIAELITRPQTGSRMEFHKKYADIQCILSGSERFLVTAPELATLTREYSEEDDVAFIESEQYNTFDVSEGLLIYFEPEEPHGPGYATADGICKSKKAIFKIRMN